MGMQKNTEYVIKSDLKDKILYCPIEFVHDCSFDVYSFNHSTFTHCLNIQYLYKYTYQNFVQKYKEEHELCSSIQYPYLTHRRDFLKTLL